MSMYVHFSKLYHFCYLTAFTSVDLRFSVITRISLSETHSQTHRQKCPHAKPLRAPIKKNRPLTHRTNSHQMSISN